MMRKATHLIAALAGRTLWETPTAFDAGGAFDAALQKDRVAAAAHSADAFLVATDLGEVLSLSAGEREELANAVIDAASDKPVVVHVGDFTTGGAAKLARHAEDVGAAAIAISLPYYWPVSEREALAYFETIIASVSLPVFLYSPSRGNGVLSAPLVQKLNAAHDQVIGLIDCAMSTDRPFDIAGRVAGFGTSFLLVADAPVAASVGQWLKVAHLSYLGWIAPSLPGNSARAAAGGDRAIAREAVQELVDFHGRIERRPERLKHVLAAAGQGFGTLRLPLRAPTQEIAAALDKVRSGCLADFG